MSNVVLWNQLNTNPEEKETVKPAREKDTGKEKKKASRAMWSVTRDKINERGAYARLPRIPVKGGHG